MREGLLVWALAWVLGSSVAAHAQDTDKAAAPAPAPAVPSAPSAPQAPEPPADPHAPAPPPPPAKDGDFAGQAEPGPTHSSPQDDFAEPEAQEYHRRPHREYSVRIDVLNWLLLGRLRIELEATVWKFITVQVVPILVTTQSPIALNYAGLDDPLTQHSRGIGPFSGASLGAGFWLSGEPFHGYVLRLEFTDYGYAYRAADKQGVFDHVNFTERRVIAFFGSHSRFGAFTFAGGFGLGYELHQVDRCGLAMVTDSGEIAGRTNDCHGKQYIALDRELNDRSDLNGPLHPVYFEARFSIGVVF